MLEFCHTPHIASFESDCADLLEETVLKSSELQSLVQLFSTTISF